jgi:putative FmdB family regulatory protein
MPIYEYICKDCGAKFETLRSIKEADFSIACRSCQSTQTERAMSVFFAQSGSKIIAGNSNAGCSGCAGGSCATCNTN